MVFLVGAYARYNWPYVWVRPAASAACAAWPQRMLWVLTVRTVPPVQLRSNHGVLSTTDKDLPLDLKTTQTWNAKGARAQSVGCRNPHICS